jgi:hypothetical protein
MDHDLAAEMAEQSNLRRKAEAPPAAPEDFWPVLRILAEEGLVTGSEAPLTTMQLGPFRLAQTSYHQATRDFLDILLPSLIVGYADGVPVHGAIAGILTGGTRAFLHLLHHGVIFGTSPQDILRWRVLVYVKERCEAGEHPTATTVVTFFTNRDVASVQDVRDSVEWLLSTGEPTERVRPALLKTNLDGSLQSLV